MGIFPRASVIFGSAGYSLRRGSAVVTRLSIRLVLAYILASCASYCASGQTTGRITGVVKDPSGGLVARADVQVINKSTNETWSATTDQEGTYNFFLLSPGLYQIEVKAVGFKVVVLTEVVARITETTIVDVTLAMGSRVETIFVKGNSAPLLQMDGPQLGAVVDSQAVANLPLASRNFTQILTLSPGTATYLPDSTAVGRNTQAISVNGARVTQNFFQIHGKSRLELKLG